VNRLREFRERAGLTQLEVVEEIHRRARERGDPVAPGLDQPAVSRHENGHRRPGPANRMLYADLFNASPAALGFRVARPEEKREHEDVDPISRRSLFGAGVGAALGLSATTASPAAAREVDPELVSHWMRLLRVLGCHDAMFGPHDVLDTVRCEVGVIAEHRRFAPGALRTQLLSVESRWAWLASWLSNDAGDWHRRDAWADRSLHLAQDAGDADMVAWSLVWQSRWAAMRHDTRGAIALAGAAQRTRGAADKIRGLGALKEAHGHALANDRAGCERSLADAYRRLDRGEPLTLSEDVGRRDDSAAPYVSADAARCWLLLRPQTAVAMRGDALRVWPQDRTRGLGVQQARLALACASDDVDRAAAEGMKALDTAKATKSDMTMRELKRLDEQLAGYDVPAAADFHEALAAAL
jgi:transcriptional regulator with XRE-family HTH domain